jgi:hypothetical protein
VVWRLVSARPTVGDEESLVARGHKVAGLPVGTVTDLIACVSPNSTSNSSSRPVHIPKVYTPARRV